MSSWSRGREPQLLKPMWLKARSPQQEKPLQWEACALQLESIPCLPQLENSPCLNEDLSQTKKKKKWHLNTSDDLSVIVKRYAGGPHVAPDGPHLSPTLCSVTSLWWFERGPGGSIGTTEVSWCYKSDSRYPPPPSGYNLTIMSGVYLSTHHWS